MALNQVGLERLTTTTTDKIGERKNLIINGAMQVAQRGTSESSVSTTQYANAPDRWRIVAGNGGTWTLSQSTTSPNLFKNSYKFDCTTADSSLGAGDFLAFDQGLEGLDLQGLGWGTSDAKSVTVSFHVRSNKTGTYTCELFQGAGAVGGSNILVSKSYTISVADTWEKKTITFSGNTAVAFTNDNSRQLTLNLWLAAGSNFTGGTFSDGTYHNANNKRVASGQVNLADSTSNEWYITGVQIEVGSVATDFEHRSFAEELALCQRYFEKSYDHSTQAGTATSSGSLNNGGLTGMNNASHATRASIRYKVTKRAHPTVTTFDLSGNSGKCNFPDTSSNVTMTVLQAGFNGCAVETAAVTTTDTRCYYHFTAESEL